MPFDGTGNWILPYNWVQDKANGIPITASRMQAQEQDMSANGFSAVVTRDAQGAPTATMPFIAGLKTDTLNPYTALGPVALTAGQLGFPASQNASSDLNTLDDYEEGTFSPIINFGGSEGGATYAVNVGRYTKIGNRVICSIYIRCTSKGAATGSLTVESLPFTSKNISGAFIGGGGYWNGMTSDVITPNWFLGPNATNIIFRNWASGTDSNILNTQCTNALEFAINPSYESET